jgi:hypothetical protein
MAELKTKPTKQNVEAFLNRIPDPKQRADAFSILALMKGITKSEPQMWGASIVGFGSFTYKYVSGRELAWFAVGFSPRKTDLTLYIMPGVGRYPALLKKLGKHKTGKSCLYIKKLDDIDLPTLKELVKQSVKDLTRMYKKSG